MNLQQFMEKLQNTPEQISFAETIQVIEENYDYHPAAFDNGHIHNAAGSNEGSCKIFAFAKHNRLTDAQTLACFGDYYRVDVLQHPDDSDHANIRQFMQTGLDGIHFDTEALTSSASR